MPSSIRLEPPRLVPNLAYWSLQDRVAIVETRWSQRV